MRRAVLAIFLVAGLGWVALASLHGSSSEPSGEASNRTPVVVELFTSEGCSSCPPADLLLQKYDAQPFAGRQLIVLSEHVDYWNHIGWTDPYSSAEYSERQSAYGRRLRLESVYTPQMIVDGTEEFVGSDAGEAKKAIASTGGAVEVPVRIDGARVEGNVVHARVETGPLPAKFKDADVVVVAALNHAESQVGAGENSGRRLTHVAVVRSLTRVGSIKSGQGFSQEVAVSVKNLGDPSGLRVIAFLQEPGQGKIVGAAVEKLSH